MLGIETGFGGVCRLELYKKAPMIDIDITRITGSHIMHSQGPTHCVTKLLSIIILLYPDERPPTTVRSNDTLGNTSLTGQATN